MLAMAIAAFPESLSVSVIQQILQGGIDAVTADGAVVAGGHTIIDNEPKYGLCVTGQIHPHRVARKHGLQVGDVLVLTKALGTGIITTAAKHQRVAAHAYAAAVASMKRSNRTAATIAMQHAVTTMTDVTGFGLLGHLLEMRSTTALGINVQLSQLPLLPDVALLAEAGVVPGGLARNRVHALSQQVTVATTAAPWLLDVACDPQTSGGLLCAVPAAQVESFRTALSQSGDIVAVIGEVVHGNSITLC